MSYLTEQQIQQRIKALPEHVKSCPACRERLNSVTIRERKTSLLVVQALALRTAIDNGDLNSARVEANTLHGALQHEQDYLSHAKERRLVLYPPCKRMTAA